ncbi:VOC family protein [Halocynthiibacter sp.]|uniref:VOC family protein n=1 Tax=Halocynthiibacter sp. TaxID=1979210 RepID=UPI003C564C15
MKLRIDHIQLAMPKGEEARARAFWHGVLGLVEIEKPASLQGRGGCWFQLDGTEIHLGVEDAFCAAKKAHPCFVVDDLASVEAKIKAAGHVIKSDAPIAGRDRFFTEDPFGNRLEFIAFEVAK